MTFFRPIFSTKYVCENIRSEPDINENYAKSDTNIRAYTIAVCHSGQCFGNL